ncbi:MAG: GspH/FimT family pseudopilin [Rhizobacter sp.]
MTTPHFARPFASGFTLIEMVVTVAVVGIVMTTATPSLASLIDTRRIDGAATQVASDLQFARAEAVSRNQPVRISFQSDATTGGSCYVIHTGSADQCRCSASGPAHCEGSALQIKTVALDATQRVSVQANVGSLVFDPLHGTASPTATLRVTGPQGRAVHQVVNLMGRVRSCSPQAAVSGYRAC